MKNNDIINFVDKKGYLLILTCYMEEETYFYGSLVELYTDWNCKSFEEFKKHFRYFSIYFINGVYDNE